MNQRKPFVKVNLTFLHFRQDVTAETKGSYRDTLRKTKLDHRGGRTLQLTAQHRKTVTVTSDCPAYNMVRFRKFASFTDLSGIHAGVYLMSQ